MECKDAQFYLRFRRPRADDLGPDEAVALDRHLATCPHCAADARLASSFDAAVGITMRAVPIPDGLRDKLVASVSAHQGALLRRKVYQAASVAASLLLAVGIGIGVFTAARPLPDTLDLAMKGDTLAGNLMADGQRVNWAGGGNPDPQAAQTNEATVRAWLAAEHLPADLPEPFDFGLLVSHHWEDVQGRKVPVVWFRERNGPGFAKVYIFRSTQFNLKGVPEAQSSYCKAQPYPSRAPGVTYLVVFTGPELAPFLRGQGGPIALAG
ncbi:MAG: hypothetical protein JWO38_163 [Gemmataceae bacterium]|nr:hypothetical protein [Gemmataceae bacterium]